MRGRPGRRKTAQPSSVDAVCPASRYSSHRCGRRTIDRLSGARPKRLLPQALPIFFDAAVKRSYKPLILLVGAAGIRTCGPLIKSQLLYQLSYAP